MCSRDAGMNSDSVTLGRLEDHISLGMFHYPSRPLRSKVEPVSLREGSLSKGNEGGGKMRLYLLDTPSLSLSFLCHLPALLPESINAFPS